MAWEVAGDEWIKSIKTSLSIESDQEELDNALQRLQSNIEDCPGEFFLQSPFVFDPPVIIEDIRIAGPLLPPLTPETRYCCHGNRHPCPAPIIIIITIIIAAVVVGAITRSKEKRRGN